jgi:hypothetical protein
MPQNTPVVDALPQKWLPLATFQTNIAKRWLERGHSSADAFAKFFFYFAGFNALYFLWGKVDDVRNQRGEPAGEEKQVENLVRKLRSDDVKELVTALNRTVRFFEERSPIQRMDRRGPKNPIDGETTEGKKWRERLRHEELPERLVALGSILYLVRSNLVHGSKVDSGDDQDIVDHAVPAVKLLLEKSLIISESALREAVS